MANLKPPFTAKDMKSLYVKVVRGHYPPIHQRYSSDLAEIINMCLQTLPSKRPRADVLINCSELKRHINDVKGASNQGVINTAPVNLLNTIKLPKKLLDITKRLPKANYSSPLVLNKKKILDIKIAKGLPEIFDKPNSRMNSGRTKARNSSESLERSPKVMSSKIILSTKKVPRGSNDISLLLRNRLYQRVMKPSADSSPKADYSSKIKLPKIYRKSTNQGHNYSVNYSCRSLSSKRY